MVLETKVEKSLLLYLESCVVDFAGKIDSTKMNHEDYKLAEKWNHQGFIKFGRISYDDIIGSKTHWVELSEHAWNHAITLRKERADRMAKNSTYGKVGCNV
jgi:hypothetical protein